MKKFASMVLALSVAFTFGNLPLAADTRVAQPALPNLTAGNSPSLGLGRIVSFRLEKPATWIFAVDHAETLRGTPVPEKLELHLQLEPHQRFAPASQSWLGKRVLFSLAKVGNRYNVWRFNAEPASPDGSSFYVWLHDNEAEIQAIKKVENLYSLPHKELRAGLIGVVEGDYPSFLKSKAMESIWYWDMNDKALRDADLMYYIAWRNNSALPWIVRTQADFFIGDGSDSKYRFSPERIDFLTKAVAANDITELHKHIMQVKLKEALAMAEKAKNGVE